MRPVNLKHVVIANNGLPESLRNDLFNFWEIKPKSEELLSLTVFVDQITSLNPYTPLLVTQLLDDCYFGFEIPRISKEFDCLWIGEKHILNIELKSQDVGAEKIKKQLFQNRCYLKHLKRDIFSFTFDSSSCKCYSLGENGNLNLVDFKNLVQAINDIHNEQLFVDNIESLFPPEEFLVSPFNSTTDFLNGYYFLTNQQEEHKNKILRFVEDSSSGNFCALTGGPGTGKTLLLYDIAQSLMSMGKNVVIGHSGMLNSGHGTLIKNGWNIVATKNLFNFNADTKSLELVEYDIYMIDEAQRCYNLKSIVEEANKKGKKCILSFDAAQIMSNDEKNRDNASYIKSLVGMHCYSLTSNIRTNADVYGFVMALFDKRSSVSKDIKKNIEITYCQTIDEANSILDTLKDKGYTVPRFTPKQFGREEYESWFPYGLKSAHEIIGQEFDNVVGLLSEKMYYDENGKLVSRGKYIYREDRMLYQILTRARHKIHIVIVNNPDILERCLKLIRR